MALAKGWNFMKKWTEVVLPQHFQLYLKNNSTKIKIKINRLAK